MEQESTPWSVIIAGVGTVVSVLSSAVAYLFRIQVKLYEGRIGQLESEVCKLSDASELCQKEHTITKVELANLKGRLEAIENSK